MTFKEIFIPNEIFYGQMNERLNVEELFLLFFFLLERNFEANIYKTNLKLLADDIKFLKDKDDNKSRIVQQLIGLMSKGYIRMNVNTEDEIRKENLLIRLPKEFKKEMGFTKVPIKYYHYSKTALEFAFLIFIEMNAFKTNTFSVKEFRSVLLNFKNKSFAPKTISKTYDELEARGIVSITRGEYVEKLNGKYRQKENKYIINSEEKITEASVVKIDDIATEIFGNKSEAKQKQEAVDFCKKLPVKLRFKDYLAVKLHSNPFVIIYAQERLDKMMAGGFNFDKWNKKLEQEQEKIKREKERLENMWVSTDHSYSEYNVEPIKEFPNKEIVEVDEIEEIEEEFYVIAEVTEQEVNELELRMEKYKKLGHVDEIGNMLFKREESLWKQIIENENNHESKQEFLQVQNLLKKRGLKPEYNIENIGS